MKLLLKPEEAAEALGVGRSKLHELLSTGAIPCIRIGTMTRVPADALRQWIAEHTTLGSRVDGIDPEGPEGDAP